MVFVFFVFIYIFSTYQIQFTSITSGNIMNGTKLISWCCKIIEIEENHMHSGINQRNFEKEILNLNCDKWTNVGESMWKGSQEIKMTSATVCISQSLTSNHFISRSHPLQSFRLFAAFHSPFFDGTSKWRFLFSVCLSSTYISICRLISLLSLFFSLSLSFSLLS